VKWGFTCKITEKNVKYIPKTLKNTQKHPQNTQKYSKTSQDIPKHPKNTQKHSKTLKTPKNAQNLSLIMPGWDIALKIFLSVVTCLLYFFIIKSQFSYEKNTFSGEKKYQNHAFSKKCQKSHLKHIYNTIYIKI
jgi:hypothetical protein